MRCFHFISYSFARPGRHLSAFSRYHGGFVMIQCFFIFSAGHTLTLFPLRFLIFHSRMA